MNADMILLALVVLFAAFGLWRGALSQLWALAAVGGGYLLSRPMGEALGPLVAASQSLKTDGGTAAATALVVLAGFAYFRVLIFTASMWLGIGGGVEGPVARLAGALAGVLAAVLLGLTALSAVGSSGQLTTYLERRYHFGLEATQSFSFARTLQFYGPFPEVPPMKLKLPSLNGSAPAAAPRAAPTGNLHPSGAAGLLMDGSDAEPPPSVTSPGTYLDKARGVQQTMDQHPGPPDQSQP